MGQNRKAAGDEVAADAAVKLVYIYLGLCAWTGRHRRMPAF